MNWNYWKCRVSKRSISNRGRIATKQWIVKAIETDTVIIRCGTWEKAIRRAIKFQQVQNVQSNAGPTESLKGENNGKG
jgi:hypothetical protein